MKEAGVTTPASRFSDFSPLAHQPIPHLRSYLKRSDSLRQVRVKMIAASRVDTIYRLGLVRTVAAGVR